MADKRYFIDKRSGCIAVCDRTKIDTDYPGLHENTPGVVQYWMGRRVISHCPTCKQVTSGGWELLEGQCEEAQKLCDELNVEEEDKCGTQ